MSVFANLWHWSQKSGVLDQVQKAAVYEVSQALNVAMTKAIAHAPDMQPQIESAAAQMSQALLAGLATKSK